MKVNLAMGVHEAAAAQHLMDLAFTTENQRLIKEVNKVFIHNMFLCMQSISLLASVLLYNLGKINCNHVLSFAINK